MKKTTFLLAALALVTVSATAQTADEIINKYADAIGGKKKLEGIKNLYMEGSIDAQGQKIPIKFWFVVKKSMRQEVTFNGMTQYSIVRNDSGWSYSPFQGQTKAEPMTAEDVKSQQSELNAPGMELIDYKAKGFKVTSQGKDNIDGSDVFKIQEIISDSNVQTYYIDPQTYYVIRVHIKITSNGKVTEANIDYADYQKTADGYLFPMTETIGSGDSDASGGGQSVKFTSIKVNTDMDAKLFSPTR
ncbi:MAG TPA: hypothetical protein VK890_10215 [Bacteroidia bacterium]|jgi:outer membrane lipoprotein-sorting protein|nr:hypothetical protein [Bacteroidia bacterium]